MSTPWQRKTIALTGTMGSGKSTASAILRKLGAFVLCADELAREVVAKDSPALAQISEIFGKEVVNPNGELNRDVLGKIVFQDAAKRKLLESITHPPIAKLAGERFEEAFAENYPCYVYDCPLFFEARINLNGFRKIVLISAPEKTCVERIMARDGLSREEAERRFRTQWSIEEKRLRSDVIIENNAGLDDLESKLVEFFNELSIGK